MWFQKLVIVKDILIPASLSIFYRCGRKLHTHILAFKDCGARGPGEKEKSKQRQSHETGSSCCACTRTALSVKRYPLTGYLFCGTDPAFKSAFSSLSFWKKHKRSTPELPSPRFLTAASCSDPDQLAFRRETLKKHSLVAIARITKSSIFTTSLSTDMPSSIELTQENPVVVSSPVKRKLSSSPTANSPDKKLLKKEIENAAEMPSSVTSSPLKESSVSNVPTTGSPSKKLSFQQEDEVKELKTVSKLQFAKLSDKAHPPSKGSEFAAGFDLKSAYEYTVPKRGSCLVKTDIQIKLPAETYGRVAPRSGLALKKKIDVGAGVIDQDYRGNVGVILFNHGDEDFQISAGDRVAQLICEKIEYPVIEEVQSLDETERGEGGFGSTGVKSQ